MTAGQLLEIILPRLSLVPQSVAFLDALETTSNVIFSRLWRIRSDLIKEDFSNVSVSADDEEVTLPSGFKGLSCDPWLIDDTTEAKKASLLPLRLGEKETYALSETGTPERYELRGQAKILLYPTPSEDWTLHGEYFKKPTAISAYTTALPYEGVFDDVFKDAVLKIGSGGMIGTSDAVFQAFIAQWVDEILQIRPKKTVAWRYPL